MFKSAFVSAGCSWLYAYGRTGEEELRLHPAHTAKMKLGLDHKKSGVYTCL